MEIFKHNDEQHSSETLSVPRHIAIIMDGNGRWANARRLPRLAGHKRGVETVRQTVKDACDIGLKYLTLYSFSSENWQRPTQEVNDLMGLLKLFIRRDLANLHKQGIRVVVVGSQDHLDDEIIELIAKAEETTAKNTGLNLVVAFNYGSKQEIADAARKIAEAVQNGELAPAQITPDVFDIFLYTSGIPEPDLLIRTSGEQRLSNFLLWQCAYTEFVFVEQPWPEFNKELLISAIKEYQSRNRRFGALKNEDESTIGKFSTANRRV